MMESWKGEKEKEEKTQQDLNSRASDWLGQHSNPHCYKHCPEVRAKIKKEETSATT